ncbi:hypothetical protein [Anabaena azotica]|uniref:hypothetical protein n=1 Tax=Anabaena azotica TaxID=197653 RepID=UPI0039A6591A
MPKHTLTEIFGTNATQTATDIIIKKADLPTLTASLNNSGSSLLVAIVLKAESVCTEIAYNDDIDKTCYFSQGFSSLTNRGENLTTYRNDEKILNISKIDEGSVIDADDY